MNRILICAMAACFLAMAGCAHGPYVPRSEPQALENTEAVVLLERALTKSLNVEGTEITQPPGEKLCAKANLRNLKNKQQKIQVQAVFKSESGMSTGDETAWKTLILSPNATETYQATALNTDSTRATIRVRRER